MSSHTFARGTLQLTYLAHSTSEALPRWKNLADSVQAEARGFHRPTSLPSTAFENPKVIL